jgi:phosphoglycolate phosphatase-like HAD superfamily hydrolase
LEGILPLKAIFFDIDGTLVGSNEFHAMAWDEAFRDHGRHFPKDQIRVQIGKGADMLILTLLPDLDERTRKAMSERHREIFQTRYLKQVKAFPHATDLIEILHAKGKKVILASSADKTEVDHYARLLKVGPMLTSTVSNDDVQNSKPAGDIFAAALAQVFPIAASETFAVGDTPYDVESAARSDVKTIALLSGGFSGEILAEAGAPYIYASVKELFDKFHSSPHQD